jgi:hypothetical protein
MEFGLAGDVVCGFNDILLDRPDTPVRVNLLSSFLKWLTLRQPLEGVELVNQIPDRLAANQCVWADPDRMDRVSQ